MSADNFSRVEEIFDAALDLPAEQRESYLDQACGDDETLREKIGRLLRHAERATTSVVVGAEAVAAWTGGPSPMSPRRSASSSGTWMILWRTNSSATRRYRSSSSSEPASARISNTT